MRDLEARRDHRLDAAFAVAPRKTVFLVIGESLRLGQKIIAGGTG